MKSESGRSMVEMLGVLAIIGVLSVGAIAGYSKAMMKYKLNKHAEAVNMLINNVISIGNALSPGNSDLTFYGTILYKLNLLPDGIKYISNDWLQDMWFKGNIWVYTYTSINLGGIGFRYDSASGQGAEICRNVIIAAKENHTNVKKMYALNYRTGKTHGIIYGDSECDDTKNKPCLRNLTLSGAESLCSTCNVSGCTMYVRWK